jgi:hypothetical protein
LAIIDLFISSIIAPSSIVEQFGGTLPGEVRFFLSYMKFSFLFLSNLMHLIVAAQRCAAVHLPTRVQTDCHTYATVVIAGCFSLALTLPVVFLRTSAGNHPRGFTVPESVSLAVFLCSIISVMSLYLDIFRTLRKRANKRRLTAQESNRPSFQFNSPRASISTIAYGNECKKLSLPSHIGMEIPTGTPQENKRRHHSAFLPQTTKSHFLASRKVVPSQSLSPMILEVPILTPVKIFQGFSLAAQKSPMHRPGSARRSTEEIINKKITLLMCISSVMYVVTWIPVWMALPGLVDSMTLKHLFFLNQVINPLLYSLSNKQFLTHLKTLVASKK